MHPSSDLQALIALDALGEATPQQQAGLKEQFATLPELSRQSAATRILVGRMEDMAGPLPPPVAVPATALAQMEAARTAALARMTVASAQAAGAANVVTLRGALPQAGATARKERVRRPRGMTQMLAWAAALVLLAAPAGWWLSQSRRTVTASPALAPRGETGMTRPTLVWENAPQQDYDVWILPEGADQKTAPALFVAQKVRSPLPFASLKPGPANVPDASELKPGTPYLALVCLAGQGRLAGVTVAFQTAPAALGAPPTPSDPAVVLALIEQMEDAGRLGDALMVIAGLPQDVRMNRGVVAAEARLRRTLQSFLPDSR